MFDITSFELIRTPQRAELNANEKLALDGPLIRQIVDMFRRDRGWDEMVQVLRQFRNSHSNPLPYADDLETPGTPVDRAFKFIGDFERWLVQHADNIVGSELSAQLVKMDISSSRAVLQDAIAELSDWVLCWLGLGLNDLLAEQEDFIADVGRSTRLVLVAALTQTPANDLASLGSEEVWGLLNLRVPVLPTSLPPYFQKAKVRLVREATVADLHVVRSEWRCYVPGEVANIRNVMAGESFRQEWKQTREAETTVTTETEENVQRQESTEAQVQSDLSREVNTEMRAQVSGTLRFEASQGVNEYNRYKVNGGADASLSISRSEREAAKVARNSVSKAIATVERRTREARVQRELSRTKEVNEYKLQNDSSDHRRGIYRWVDRIDRYQIFRYTNRLQLEFQLPEPAEYYRRRTAHEEDARRPPDWNISDVDIQPNNIVELAARYRATNLPPHPDLEISVVRTIVGSLPDDQNNNWNDIGPIRHNPPQIQGDIEIPIPDDYIATSVDYAGYATPLFSKWAYRQMFLTESDTHNPREGFRTIVATILCGQDNDVYFTPGLRLQQPPPQIRDVKTYQSVYDNEPGRPNIGYGEAVLPIPGTKKAISPGAATILKVAAGAAGARTLSLTFKVNCTLRRSAEEAWRNACYDALFAAWNQWNQEWQAAQARRALVSAVPSGESSSARNSQILRDELKRQVIAWLLDESPFLGRNGLSELSPLQGLGWREIDFDAARAAAPTIQFLEQAFEWSNISYVFYPYYWADRTRWDELSSLQGTDPDFERFLKAGSARVVVPARPGMEAAVHHWLLYQVPFLGQPMPVPGEPMYVSIATEIHDLTRPPEGGIPGESWETRVGTTLVWLDNSGGLPSNPLARLGKVPNEPRDVLSARCGGAETKSEPESAPRLASLGHIGTWLVLGPIFDPAHQVSEHWSDRSAGSEASHPWAEDIIRSIDQLRHQFDPFVASSGLDNAPKHGDFVAYGDGADGLISKRTYVWRRCSFSGLDWSNIHEVSDNIHLFLRGDAADNLHEQKDYSNFAGKHHALAFFAAFIESPNADVRRLYARSDDSSRVWLNGVEIQQLQHIGERDIAHSEDVAEVALRPGWNILVAAVAETHVEWGLSVRIQPDVDLRLTTTHPDCLYAGWPDCGSSYEFVCIAGEGNQWNANDPQRMLECLGEGIWRGRLRIAKEELKIVANGDLSNLNWGADGTRGGPNFGPFIPGSYDVVFDENSSAPASFSLVKPFA